MYGIFVVGPNQSGTNVRLVPPRYIKSFPTAVHLARGIVLGGQLRTRDEVEVTRLVSGGNTIIYRVNGDGSERFTGPNTIADAREPRSGDTELRAEELEGLAKQTISPGGEVLAEGVAVLKARTLPEYRFYLAEAVGVAAHEEPESYPVPTVALSDPETMERLVL